MEQAMIETTSAVALDNFERTLLFTLKNFDGLYIGEKKFYEIGEYDNSTNTLQKISDSKKLLHLLNGHYSHIALAKFIAEERYSIKEIKEFYEICKKLKIKFYQNIDSELNDTFYKTTNYNKKQRKQQMEKKIELADGKGGKYLIFWAHTLDGKRWARCTHKTKSGEQNTFGKFKTKKQAEEYIKQYLIDNGEILPF